jgi:hypothetical protein
MSERDAEPSSLPGMEAELFPPPDSVSTDLTAEAPAVSEMEPALSQDEAPEPELIAATEDVEVEATESVPPAPPEPEPPAEPEFPKPLVASAEKLSRNLHDPALLPQAFADFCSVAYAKPEWVGAASAFLAEQFEGREEELADMARVPDLIIELASGHYALSFMAASVWAERCDIARLARMAEALMAKLAVKSMPASAEVVDLMLALATSLAISRYARAEQLVQVATPLAMAEHQQALAEARLWLAIGRLVRSGDQEVRDLWDQRLRRPRHRWTWELPVEQAALAQLADVMTPTAEGLAWFQPVVPACWWDLALRRATERAAVSETRVVEEEPREKPPTAEPTPVVSGRPVVVWHTVPFFVGGLVGAWAFALGVWLGPFDLVRPTENEPAAAEVPVAAVKESPAPAEDRPVQGDTTQRLPATVESPVATSPAPASSPTPADHPDRVWREEEKARLLAEHPELASWAESFRSGTWTEHRALLEGADTALPKDDPEYVRLLVWLHLAPAADAEVNARVPGLLATYQPESFVLDLWQRLIYPGSPNAAQIKQAARFEHHDRPQSWSPSQRARLNLIGWPPES